MVSTSFYSRCRNTVETIQILLCDNSVIGTTECAMVLSWVHLVFLRSGGVFISPENCMAVVTVVQRPQ